MIYLIKLVITSFGPQQKNDTVPQIIPKITGISIQNMILLPLKVDIFSLLEII